MRFTVVIHGLHDNHALQFVQAALDVGHEVPLVFFYQEAVRIADLRANSPQVSGWRQLQHTGGFELAICIGAATRRGIIDESTLESPSNRIAEGFEVVGLGQLVAAMAESDRLITFAA